MKKKILALILLFFIAVPSFCYSKTQKEEYQNDALYSEEYFNYLIECANSAHQDELDRQKLLKKQAQKQKEEISLVDEITEDEPQEVISDKYTPFKLYITEYNAIPNYTETFKKVDSKTIIRVSDNFSFVQDLAKTKNKYNSNDYRILAGAEYKLHKNLNFALGLETNYRGIDQNPTSRKLYFTPSIFINDKLSLSFINKYNPQSGVYDHDLNLKISPFKTQAVNFGVYSGLTRNSSGSTSESISFSTNFLF